MQQYTHPHVHIDVIDASMPPAQPEPDTRALHKPFFLGFTERGDVNTPFYGTFSGLASKLGKATFDQYYKGFHHPNLFAYTAAQHQAIYFIRLADETVKTATMVLEARVKDVELIQYQRDVHGGIILGPDGKPLPKDPEVKEPGISLTWALRPIQDHENPNMINIQTVGEETIYPILIFKANSPGEWAKFTGIRLWFDPGTVDKAMIDNVGSLIYFMEFVEQPYGFDTLQTIRTFFGNKFAEFSMDYDALDKTTDRRMYLDEIINNEYGKKLPYSVRLMTENVKLIGERVREKEPNRTDLTTPFMVNIVDGRDLNNYTYDHFIVETTHIDPLVNAVVMDPNVTHYLQGGEDGEMTNAKLEQLTSAYLTGNVYSEILDNARYPITHFYDSGYTLECKKNIIDFLSLRDDVKVVMSTQDSNNPPNSKAEDQSTGSAIRSRLLLHPESLIFGTSTFRGTIFQQCGRLKAWPTYRNHVPATIDCLIKKCRWQGSYQYKGEPTGYPNSEVTCFDVDTINWTPTTADHKQLSWDTGLNYMQFFDSTHVHYPSVVSVYPYAISLLSDDIIGDILIYLKHIARYEWSLFVGKRQPFATLAAEVITSISKHINSRFSNSIKTNVSMYQTDIDKYKGYANTIKIELISGFPQRISHVLIPVLREEG